MSLKEFSATLRQKKFPIEFPGHYVGNARIFNPKAPVLKDTFNPSRNEKLLTVRLDSRTLQEAVDGAAMLFQRQKPADFADRIAVIAQFRKILTDYEGDLITIKTLEAGKPRWEAEHDVRAAMAFLDEVVDAGEGILDGLLAPFRLVRSAQQTVLRPIGPSLAFLPFSTPCRSFVQYFVASVLSASPMVMVSSAHAVIMGLFFSYVLEELGLPKGSLQIIFGNFTFFKEALQDRRFAAVIYKGSREHCDVIRKESQTYLGREHYLQSGGKNSLIVHESADVEAAVRATVLGISKGAGQLCSSTSRAFVHKAVFERFCERLQANVHEMTIGTTDGPGDNPRMGPLYSEKAVDKFLRFQTMAKREAQSTLSWGKALDGALKGFFVRPGLHILKELDGNSAYQSNVLMSPDLAIYQFEDMGDAVAKANHTDACLVTSLFGDPAIVTDYAAQSQAPNIFINIPTVDREISLPLSGRRQSGNRRLNSLALCYYLTYPQAIVADKGLWPDLNP